MKASLYTLCAWGVALIGTSLQAAPSVVTLDSGEQLIGEILPQSTPETVFMRSAVLGEVQLQRTRVLSIRQKDAAAGGETAAKPAVAASVEPSAVGDVESAEVETAEMSRERRLLETLKEFKAPDVWSGNLRFGVNLSQGDSRWTETFARGQLEIKPQSSPNFYRFNGSYTYRETERRDGSSFKSTDKYDAQFIYRRSFGENWFLQNSLGGRVDQVKGIDRELQEAVGLGYTYKPVESFELLFGAGGGVEELETDYEDTRAGLSPLANVFQEATWRPLPRTSFVQKFNYYWNPENSEQFNYVLTAALRVRLTDLLGFEFAFNKSFDNDVGTGDARDDTQWRNALVIYF
jgi:putative salt-induced outer membrane protein YdiY